MSKAKETAGGQEEKSMDDLSKRKRVDGVADVRMRSSWSMLYLQAH